MRTITNTITTIDIMENNDIEALSDKYVIEPVTKSDILDSLNLNTEDRNTYNSIISQMEKIAAEGIKNNKCINLPFIGCIRRSPIQQVISKNHKLFKIARKHLSKEDYKDHVRCIVEDAKEKIKKEDKLKLKYKRIKTTNKKKYEEYYKNLGYVYAQMFIYSIALLKEVPFDQEFQDYYDSLKEEDNG